MRRIARCVLLLLLGLVGVTALSARARSGAALAQDVASVQAPIQALDDAIIGVMKAGRQTPFPQRYSSLEPAVVKAIDIQAILQGAVGLSWSSLPAERQSELKAAFQRFTVATYVANFDTYNGERFRIDPALRAIPGSTGEAEQVVQTQLVHPSGETTRIDYVMRQSAGAWRAVDVLLDGSISRVAVLRSDFRSMLAAGDGAALLDNLRKKVSDLSAGTLQ